MRANLNPAIREEISTGLLRYRGSITGLAKGDVEFMETLPRLKGFWRPGIMDWSENMNSRFAAEFDESSFVRSACWAAYPKIMVGSVFGRRYWAGCCEEASDMTAVEFEKVPTGRKAKKFPPTVVYGPCRMSSLILNSVDDSYLALMSHTIPASHCSM